LAGNVHCTDAVYEEIIVICYLFNMFTLFFLYYM